jgi:hypothetical protein
MSDEKENKITDERNENLMESGGLVPASKFGRKKMTT